VLGRVVGGAVCDSKQARDGCDVDDAARTLLEHDPAKGAAEEKGPQQIDVHDAPPFRRRDVFGRGDRADAGIVDQHVDPSEPGYHRICHAFYGGFVGDVAQDFDCVNAMASDFGCGFGGGAQVVEGERKAALRQYFGGTLSDALGSSGDESDLHEND
jgi:hypothetical protein